MSGSANNVNHLLSTLIIAIILLSTLSKAHCEIRLCSWGVVSGPDLTNLKPLGVLYERQSFHSLEISSQKCPPEIYGAQLGSTF